MLTCTKQEARNTRKRSEASDTLKFYFRPVIPLLVAMMAGIVLGARFTGDQIWVFPLVALCLIIICNSIGKQKSAPLVPLIFFVIAGYLSIQPWLAPKFPAHHIVHFADGQSWRIGGVVNTHPNQYFQRQTFILRVETLSEKNRSSAVTGKIRVTITGNPPSLTLGDRIEISSRIRSIRNFNNPGGFDYQRYMAFKGVWVSAYISKERLTVLERKSKTGISTGIATVRRRIADLIDTTGSGEEQDLLKALIIGDKQAVSQDLRMAFNRAGIGHLLAISGLHIGIVATTAFVMFRWLLSRFSIFLWYAWTQKGAVVISVVPVVVYGMLSGMSPSTQRAVIMVIVFLMTFLFEREHDLLNTLALAAMLILVVDPPSLFSISFQLSFITVFSIIYGMIHLQNIWKPQKDPHNKVVLFQLQKRLFTFCMASVFAILGSLPLVMYYFNQVSLVGMLSNLLIVPVVGFVVVPVGLLAVFLYPFAASGAFMCLHLSGVLLSQVIDVVYYLSELSFAAFKTVTPSGFEICCYYLLFFAVLNLSYKRSKQVPKEGGQDAELVEQDSDAMEATIPNFKHKLALVATVMVIIALGCDGLYWFNRRFRHDDLKVTMIDVGQGSCALLELPGGPCFLIDGGGFSDNRFFDVGARIVAPYLWRKKIGTIDTLILSHPNTDHLNGLLYIARYFNVKRVWTNGQAADTLSYDEFKRTTKAMQIYTPGFHEIARNQHINGVRLQILYPPDDFMGKSKQERWRDANNNSLVVRVTFGSASFLFPGDIKQRAERELAAMIGDGLKSTVLLSPHHGSKTSSTQVFLDTVRPQFVIIPCGWKNRFKFPHKAVIQRYKERGCRVLRTDLHGAITVSTDGQSLTVEPTISN